MGHNHKEVAPVPDTQDFITQSSQIWAESQPMDPIVWGRLCTKNRLLKSLGMRLPKFLYTNTQESFDLCKEKFSAGRAETNDLVLTIDDLPEKVLCRISKVHFTITRNLEQHSNPVYIQDFSRNGTFVNGMKIGINNRRILQDDDYISLSHPTYKAFVFKDLSPNEGIGLPTEICSQYFISRKLGSGACGVVRLIYNRLTCEQYAMKHVQKNMLSVSSKRTNLNDPNRVMNEVHIMKALEHPCVIKMVDIVNKPDSVYMVLELMEGGDLLTRIISNKRLSERISKLFFYQMCHAVKYLHDKGITHRDLKPDNVLLDTQDEETLLKVSDFGLSKFVQKDSVMRTLCGTPLYVAPEVLLTGGRGSYTNQVDIWSLGVVLYTCLSGTLPFSDDYGSLAIDQIKLGKFQFNHPSWLNVSTCVKSLISEMLTVNVTKRPSIDYILKHKWLRDPQIIRKANILMKLTPLTSDEENFLEPPTKRTRR